jgi:hypothetical protein
MWQVRCPFRRKHGRTVPAEPVADVAGGVQCSSTVRRECANSEPSLSADVAAASAVAAVRSLAAPARTCSRQRAADNVQQATSNGQHALDTVKRRACSGKRAVGNDQMIGSVSRRRRRARERLVATGTAPRPPAWLPPEPAPHPTIPIRLRVCARVCARARKRPRAADDMPRRTRAARRRWHAAHDMPRRMRRRRRAQDSVQGSQLQRTAWNTKRNETKRAMETACGGHQARDGMQHTTCCMWPTDV